jgi:hypothetical protein
MRGLLFATLLVSTLAGAADDGIVTERPSFVDSSETVGIGRLQIETGVQDAHDTGSSNDWTIPTLLRWGVADDWEVRFESDTYERSNADSARYVDGWSNLTVGIKHHVGGDSADGPSSAWFAEVEMPTGATPFRGQGARPSARWVTEWELPANCSFAVMPGLKYDNGDNGRFVSGSVGATLGKNFSEAAMVFVELAAPQIAAANDGGTQLSFDTGVQYRIGKNFQIDSAVDLGLNHRTPDRTLTVGASAKW